MTADVVVLRRPAEIHGGNFLQLGHRVHGCHVVAAAHGKRGIAAELPLVVRQLPAAVATLDDAVGPVALQNFRGHAGRGAVGIGAKIAHTGVNVELAFRRQPHQPVEAVETGGMERLADAHAGNLRAVALSAQRLALLPVELLGGHGKRFGHVRAGQRDALRTVHGALARRVDHANLQAVEPQFPRRLVDQRLHARGHFVLTRPALGRSRRRVGEYAQTAEPH